MFLRGKSEFILRFRAKFSSPNNKQNFSKFKHTRISREIWLHPRYYFRVKRRKENSSLSYYFIIRFLKFLKKKNFDSISLHTIRYNFTQITDSLRARKTSILSDFLLFFF